MAEAGDGESVGDLLGDGFERDLVWLLLFDRDFGARLSGRLEPDHMARDAARTVVGVVRAYREQAGDAPGLSVVVATLRERTRAGAAQRERDEAVAALRYVRALVKRRAPSDTEREFVRAKVKDFVTRRAVYASLHRLVNAYQDGTFGDDHVRDLSEAVREGERSVAPSLGVEVYGGLPQKITRYRSRDALGARWPLGLRLLDKAMRGGMEPGKLGLVMGPSTRGKTLMLVNVGAAALAQGAVVAHVTLEIDALEVEARYDARVSQVQVNALMGVPADADWARRIAEAHRRAAKGRKGRLWVREYGTGEASVADLSAYLDALRCEIGRGVDVVIVDYLDLMRAPGKVDADSFRHAIAGIARGLRGIARDHACAVWTASQTGRQGFAAAHVRPQDVSESIEKVNVSDVIIGICQTDAEKARGVARLALLKNRLGGNEGLVVDVLVNARTQTVTQSPTQTALALGHSEGPRPQAGRARGEGRGAPPAD